MTQRPNKAPEPTPTSVTSAACAAAAPAAGVAQNMAGIEEYLDECYREEFARVVAAWGLRDVRKRIEGGYGWCDYEHEAVTLRLSNEHGGTACEIRPRGEERFTYVPEFMRLADHIGNKASGFEPERRRYSLRDQCDMLIERKDEIIRVSSPAFAEERRSLTKKFSAAYMAQFEKRANQPPEPTR